MPCCLPFGKAGRLQILYCQGIKVAYYNFTLDALALKPSDFCNNRVNSEELSYMNIREIVFDPDDFLDQEKMIQKLDLLIHAWGQELIQYKHIDDIPDTDEAWLKILEMDIHWSDLNSQWEHYVVGCLIFFLLLRSDIKRDFLLQPDYIRGQRLSRWLGRLRHYQTPLSKDIVTKFCLCYSMIMEKKPIKVRYNDI